MFESLNWPAILVATLAAFGFGALWYSPLLFGKRWQRELGFTDQYLRQGNFAVIFGRGLLFTFLMTLGVALFLAPYENPHLHHGLHVGLLAGLLIGAVSLANNYNYQRRSLVLWLIDGGYTFFLILIVALILSAW